MLARSSVLGSKTFDSRSGQKTSILPKSLHQELFYLVASKKFVPKRVLKHLVSVLQ